MPSTNPIEIALITALPAEAKALIGLLKLKKSHPHSSFDYFLSDNKQTHLIVSGTGTLNAAAATAFLAAQLQQPKSACLCNIGIAGGQQPIGSLWQCHKIIDSTTGHHFYPTLHHHQLPSIDLITYTQEQTHYSDSFLMDREASGFFHAANRFV